MTVRNGSGPAKFTNHVPQFSDRIESLLLGVSPGIRRVRALVERFAPKAIPVLIEGPTGAGKELVAQAIHLASGRQGDFVAFNVCALSESLFEAALFGHVRGAFTGAAGDSQGLLLEADKGTVFLDEIGGLSLAAQPKLLRALELRTFRPIGGKKDRTSDFRVVAATNESIESLAAAGRFRDDLRYRLGGVIKVPGLDERREDIAILARHFAKLCRESSTALALGNDPAGVRDDRVRQLADTVVDAPITRAAIALLEGRTWPGNVRELRVVIECAAALSDSRRIRVSDIETALRLPGSATSKRSSAISTTRDGRRLETLLENAWDVDATAAFLGVHRATLYRTLHRIKETSAMAGVERPKRVRG